jgi:hypothetical protein
MTDMTMPFIRIDFSNIIQNPSLEPEKIIQALKRYNGNVCSFLTFLACIKESLAGSVREVLDGR